MHPQPVQIAEIQPREGAPDQGLFREGEKIAFRVLDALPLERYRIAARHQVFVVTSRIPLAVGHRYVAEVAIREGRVLLLYQTTARGLADLLSGCRVQTQNSLPSILQGLSSLGALPPSLTLQGQSAETVRMAVLHAGLFYEAKLREWLEKRESWQPLHDLKGYLLARLREAGPSSLREAVAAALRQIEAKQLAILQGGAEAAVPFCLPFGEQRFIEGFVKRTLPISGSDLVVALRVSFPGSGELLVVISWRPREADIFFSSGEPAHGLLLRAAPGLEERLGEIGLTRVRVRVSKRLPRQARQLLKGSGFFDAYG
jgi:hypothetical protein